MADELISFTICPRSPASVCPDRVSDRSDPSWTVRPADNV